MDVGNKALLASIERIMKLPYFDGINETENSSDMLQDLMANKSYNYVLLLAKYFDKNNVIFGEDDPLIAVLKSGHASEKWLMMYFDMLKKRKMSVAQDILKKALDSMDSIKLKEEQEREKCKSILKRHLIKN